MHRRGFTLIELMIVVAIIAILASIAIPSFLNMRLRARRAELPTNIDGMSTAEKAYFIEFDSFTTVGSCRSVASQTNNPRQAAAFEPAYCSSQAGYDSFLLLGWIPDGRIYGHYYASQIPVGVEIYGESDVDGDGTTAEYTISIDDDTNTELAPGVWTTPNNVY